jgi:hypothetical protein
MLEQITVAMIWVLAGAVQGRRRRQLALPSAYGGDSNGGIGFIPLVPLWIEPLMHGPESRGSYLADGVLS